MTRYVLQITLRSPLTSAAGEGRVGLVDRDVAFDNLGLPILPGRRLKGLWREAYRDVAEAWALCGQPAISVDRIFGEAGQKPGAGAACLHVANAELHDAATLRPWLTYLQHPDKPKLHPDDVVQHFAAVRAQTAIDRRTGAARGDTLRFTRTLRAGLVFWASVRFVQSPETALLDALALGAASLQRMGTARTRGLGQVCCRLLALDAGRQTHDVLAQLSTGSSMPVISAASPVPPPCTSTGPRLPVLPAHRPPPTHLLRYRLLLTAPTVIPTADSDPNTVATRLNVPGSHLWGFAAWHYLQRPGHAPEDRAFCRAFLDGSLRFLTAYPEARDFNETRQRLIPVPHSIRKYKNAGTLVDLAELLSEETNEPVKRLNGRYAKIGYGQLELQEVKTEFNYHHARARDRRRGRALGAEVADGGAFFVYEAIQARQSFQGVVLGSEDDLQDLQHWLHEVDSITVGRSRSAQYGTAMFEWIDETPQAWQTMVSEWDGFVKQEAGAFGLKTVPSLLGERLIITTLSPLLTVNDYGHPEACFPERELAHALGLESSAKNLTLVHSYTRTELIGGYHAHLRLPRQQWPAIAAGSAFVFDVASVQSSLVQECLVQLEREGLGLRKGEGYGRIAVNRQGALDLTGMEETSLDDLHDNPTVPAPPVPRSIQDLLCDMVRLRCLSEMQRDAATVAQSVPRNQVPSHALLGRLRLFLEQDSPIESLDNLRQPAMDQLTNCRIDTHRLDISWLQNQLTLHALFKKALSRPETLTRELIVRHVEELLEDHGEVHSTIVDALANNDGSAALCREFLLHLLTVLYRRIPTRT